VLDDENDILKRWHEHDDDLSAMVRVCENAMKPYMKTREALAPFSVKAAKDVHRGLIGVHPLFRVISTRIGDERAEGEIDMLDSVEDSCDAKLHDTGRIKSAQ